MLFTISLLVVACASAAEPPARTPATSDLAASPEMAASPETTASPETGLAPVTVRLEGPDAPSPGRIALTLVVDRHIALAIPMTVTVTAPEGARLIEPQSEITLPAATAPRVDRIAIVVECEAIPAADLLVTVNARSEAAGFHAEPVYRFGRAAPLQQAPPLADPVVVGGHDVGRPVQMTPR